MYPVKTIACLDEKDRLNERCLLSLYFVIVLLTFLFIVLYRPFSIAEGIV